MSSEVNAIIKRNRYFTELVILKKPVLSHDRMLLDFKREMREEGTELPKKYEEVTISSFESENADLMGDIETDKERAIRRARAKIKDYVLSNTFKYFVTLTFDRKKHDSSNRDKLIRIVGKWLNNYKQRSYSALKYLLIFELHKDKEHFHIHGFLNEIPENDIVFFKKHKKYGNRYNWLSWSFKFGHNSLIEIGQTDQDYLKMAQYVTKYVSKDIDSFEKFKQSYVVSKGLNLPDMDYTYLDNVDNISWANKTFENSWVMKYRIPETPLNQKLHKLGIYDHVIEE